MILAVRPQWLMTRLNGLDKGYRLHKWLGISALTTAIIHWWLGTGTKWMVGWGWLARPERRGTRGGGEQQSIETVQQLFGSWRGLAETIGEWTFYVSAILLIMALIKWFPYRWFIKFHKLLAVGYIALAFHTLVLFNFADWSYPMGWFMAIFLLVGTVSAFLVLFKRVGKKRQFSATISSITRYNGLDGYDVVLDVPQWAGHKAGQFAFINNHNDREKPHPFTIASNYNGDTSNIRFLIKSLGDFTSKLGELWKIGDSVTVEGSYGEFAFEDTQAQQIWVAGGIGITPFLARLQALSQASKPREQAVTLFYSYQSTEQSLLDEMQQLAEQANVNLHLWSSDNGRLTAEAIRKCVPDWQQASLWFCGSKAFGKQLQKDFVKHGLPAKQFHQELFEMR